MDRVTRAPVLGAQVVVLGRGIVQSTDADGAFIILELAPGSYFLQIRKPGYQQGVWQVSVLDSGVVLASFELEPLPVTLPAEVVEGTPRSESYWYRDFERRRAARRGEFVTREEIERHGLATLGDLLRTVPGLRMVCGRGGCSIRMTRWGGCRPFYF